MKKRQYDGLKVVSEEHSIIHVGNKVGIQTSDMDIVIEPRFHKIEKDCMGNFIATTESGFREVYDSEFNRVN